MPSNWEGLNIGLGDIGKALGDRAREQRAKQEAIEMLYQKALIEQEMSRMDPYKQAIARYISGFMPQGRSIDTTGVDEQGRTVGGGEIAPMGGMSGGGDYWLKPTFGPSGPSLSMEMTPEAEVRQKTKEARATRRASLEEEMSVKRETLSKDLDSFIALDDIIQQARGTGLGRFEAGLKIGAQSISQKSRLGKTAAAYDAASKRLRVQLVRAAGDVGNINIVEQEAAEKLIPSKWDDAGTASIKRAYLRQVAKAINDNSPNELKKVLDEIGIGYINIGNKNKYESIWGD